MDQTKTLAAARTMRAIYTLAFILTVHAVLPTYINSSFVAGAIGEGFVGVVYTIAALLTVFGFAKVTGLLQRHGNYRVALLLTAVQFLAMLGLIFLRQPALVILAFIVSQVAVQILGFNLDIFLENVSSNERTGATRGLYLTVINIAWIISPILVALILKDDAYRNVYALSAALLIPFLFLLSANFKTFRDTPYENLSIAKILRGIPYHRNTSKILMSNVILQFFFAWMVIYMPIYLHEHVGFSWETVSIMFTIMLVPYVLLEGPLGKIADRHLGEKELLTAGFVILALSTGLLSFVTSKSVLLWSALLFVTRVGASMVEVMNETYFFKKADSRNASIVGFYRMTRPLAYIVAPLLATLVLSLAPYNELFLVLGAITLLGLRYSLTLEDTR